MTYRRLSRLRQEGSNMNEHLVVAKFGGTSVADASQFRKIKEIVSNNPERRFIVVSAPGKRFPEDRKVTDLLLDCYEKAAAGESFADELSRIKARFQDIGGSRRILCGRAVPHKGAFSGHPHRPADPFFTRG